MPRISFHPRRAEQGAAPDRPQLASHQSHVIFEAAYSAGRQVSFSVRRIVIKYYKPFGTGENYGG